MKLKHMLLVAKAQIMANRKIQRKAQDELINAKCELVEARAFRRQVKHPERMSEFDIQNYNAVQRVLRKNPFVQY